MSNSIQPYFPSTGFELSFYLNKVSPAMNSHIHQYMIEHCLSFVEDYIPENVAYLTLSPRVTSVTSAQIEQIARETVVATAEGPLGVIVDTLNNSYESCLNLLISKPKLRDSASEVLKLFENKEDLIRRTNCMELMAIFETSGPVSKPLSSNDQFKSERFKDNFDKFYTDCQTQLEKVQDLNLADTSKKQSRGNVDQTLKSSVPDIINNARLMLEDIRSDRKKDKIFRPMWAILFPVSKEELKARLSRQKGKLEKLERVLKRIQTMFQKYEDYFSGEQAVDVILLFLDALEEGVNI